MGLNEYYLHCFWLHSNSVSCEWTEDFSATHCFTCLSNLNAMSIACASVLGAGFRVYSLRSSLTWSSACEQSALLLHLDSEWNPYARNRLIAVDIKDLVANWTYRQSEISCSFARNLIPMCSLVLLVHIFLVSVSFTRFRIVTNLHTEQLLPNTRDML